MTKPIGKIHIYRYFPTQLDNNITRITNKKYMKIVKRQ